jgi:hypothetical protein
MREAIGVGASYDEDGGAIYHGDCLRVLPALPAGSVDLVLTDPPYLVSYQEGWDGERKAIVGDESPSLAPSRLQGAVAGAETRHLRRLLLRLAARGPVRRGLQGDRLTAREPPRVREERLGLGRSTRGQHETAYLLAKVSPSLPAHGISDFIEWEREPGVVDREVCRSLGPPPDAAGGDLALRRDSHNSGHYSVYRSS